MKRAQAESIFNELYSKTFNEAYGYILAKTGDTVATPRILKECYCELFRKFLKERTDEIENKRSYLFKIIRNQLIKYDEETMRSLHPETTRIKKYTQFLEEELATELPDPQNKAELQEMLDKTLALIAEKPELQRRAFMLHHLYDFSIEQVASELSLSEMSVGNYIYNLTKEIRIMFQADSNNEQKEEQA